MSEFQVTVSIFGTTRSDMSTATGCVLMFLLNHDAVPMIITEATSSFSNGLTDITKMRARGTQVWIHCTYEDFDGAKDQKVYPELLKAREGLCAGIVQVNVCSSDVSLADKVAGVIAHGFHEMAIPGQCDVDQACLSLQAVVGVSSAKIVRTMIPKTMKKSFEDLMRRLESGERGVFEDGQQRLRDILNNDEDESEERP